MRRYRCIRYLGFRQAGISLKAATNPKMRSSGRVKAVIEGLITITYDLPRHDTKAERTKAIAKFADTVYLACLKPITKN